MKGEPFIRAGEGGGLSGQAITGGICRATITASEGSVDRDEPQSNQYHHYVGANQATLLLANHKRGSNLPPIHVFEVNVLGCA